MTYPTPLANFKERRETYGKDVGQVALAKYIQYLRSLRCKSGFVIA